MDSARSETPLQQEADAIAECAIASYNALPKKGKPQPHEWTVLAAIVAETLEPGRAPKRRCMVVSTGTKCVGQRDMSALGDVVNDCHAEILSRRAWKLQVMAEMEKHCRTCIVAGRASDAACTLASHCILAHSVRDGKVHFTLRKDIRLWLYISDSPCGSAAEYADPESGSVGIGGGRRTGAKLVQGATVGAGAGAGDGENAALSANPMALRTKSGRSDLPAERRTQSMCCSDKVCRWLNVPGGWSGSLLHHMSDDAREWGLHGLVVSAGEGVPAVGGAGAAQVSNDHQLHTLQQALLHRASSARTAAYSHSPGARTSAPPQLCVTSRAFGDGRVSKAAAIRATGALPVEPQATLGMARGATGQKRGHQLLDGAQSSEAKRPRHEEGGEATGQQAQAPPAVSLVPAGMSIVAWDERAFGYGAADRPAWVVHTIIGTTGKRGGSTGTGKGKGAAGAGEKEVQWKDAPPVCKAKLWDQAEKTLAALAQAQQSLSPSSSSAPSASPSPSPSASCAHARYRDCKTCTCSQGTGMYRAALEAFHGPGLGFEGWLRGDAGLEAFPLPAL